MQRRPDIDRTKGFAILLVVFGHLVARADPLDVTWYEPLRHAVYSFHMPLFLYLSGLAAVLSGGVLRPRAEWRAVAAARAKRLLVPFFGLGLLVVAGKLALAPELAIDNVPSGAVAGLFGLVWWTQASPALSVWYLFVLFVVSLAAMLALDGRRERLPWLLALCLLLYALPLPAVMYADRVGRFAVFFAFGVAAGFGGARWEAFVDRSWPWLLAVFTAGLGIIVVFGQHWPEKLTLLPMGTLSMPAIHGWLRFMPAKSFQVLTTLGRFSFMIYLFNTMFIGLAKGMLLRFCAWDGANFLPFAIVLMTSGVLGPMALKYAVFRRMRVLDRLTN